MSWFIERKNKWRMVIILGMIVAFLGPWVLERLYIPAEYECPIRIDNDFCGLPQSGISLLFWLGSGFAAGLVTGEFSNPERTGEFLLISLFILLPLLPILGTLLLIKDQDNLRKQGFAIIFWILAIGFGLFIGLTNYPELFCALWGIWLYIAVAVSALILEIIVYLSNRKTQKESDLKCLSRGL
jgi:hypothetical protein